MSDFYQNGVVTVLHRLGQPNVKQLEQELTRYGRVNPIALVLPSLYSELGRPALKAIVETLKTVSYLNEIVISLDRASALEFRLAKQFFSVLPQRVRLIWNDGARIQEGGGQAARCHRLGNDKRRVALAKAGDLVERLRRRFAQQRGALQELDEVCVQRGEPVGERERQVAA